MEVSCRASSSAGAACRAGADDDDRFTGHGSTPWLRVESAGAGRHRRRLHMKARLMRTDRATAVAAGTRTETPDALWPGSYPQPVPGLLAERRLVRMILVPAAARRPDQPENFDPCRVNPAVLVFVHSDKGVMKAFESTSPFRASRSLPQLSSSSSVVTTEL